MKYFTKEWCFGNLSDAQIEQKLNNYKKYINKIYNKLPFVLKILAKSINLHDGRLKKISFVQARDILILNGIFGDLESGYYSLEIQYLNVSKLNSDILISVFQNQEIEILSDEIEMFKENWFSHKIIFSTSKEIDIQFNDLQIFMHSATSKDYQKNCCHFEIM